MGSLKVDVESAAPEGATSLTTSSSVKRNPRWVPAMAAVAAVGAAAMLYGGNLPDPPDAGSTIAPATTSSLPGSSFPGPSPSVDSTSEPSQIEGSAALDPYLVGKFEPMPLGSEYALVGLRGNEYVVVDLRLGEITAVPLAAKPVQVAFAENRMIFVLDETETVKFLPLGGSEAGVLATDVDYFIPSANPGRVWLGVPDVDGMVLETDIYAIGYRTIDRSGPLGIDPRYRYVPGGGLYEMGGRALSLTSSDFSSASYLGPHVPLATSQNGVIGRICDEALNCRIEEWRDGGPWQEVVSVPAGVDLSVEVSSSGDWIAVESNTLTIYRSLFADAIPGAAQWSFPGTLEGGATISEMAFAPLDDLAFVVDSALLVVVALGSTEREVRMIDPAALAGITDWVAVPNWESE